MNRIHIHRRTCGKPRFEARGTTIGLVALLILVLPACDPFAHDPALAKSDIEIRVVAQKYAWHFHYAGGDGIFGKTDNARATAKNPLGLDFTDRSTWDDVHSDTLVMPVDCKVRLGLTSLDVIHSLGQLPGGDPIDAAPGVKNHRMVETPDGVGTGPLKCVQLCGVGHSGHTSTYRLVKWNEYQEWLKTQPPAKDEAEK